MRIVKLSKKDYTYLEDLLIKVGLINKEKQEVYPQNIFVNEKTRKKMKSLLYKEAKQKYPELSKQGLAWIVETYFFQYAPSLIKGGGNNLPVGYAVVVNKE
jgi:hypothetical protein